MSAALSFSYISRWCSITSVHLLPFSCLHRALLILSASFSLSPSLCFSSHLYLCLPLSFFPFSYWHSLRTSTSTSLPFFLSPLSFALLSLSLSLRCVLMNCLPLPVNSTDNPGEAVKDHRSALQTGPQATAQEQHANNKPLHSALCMHICACMHERVFVNMQPSAYMCKLHACMQKHQVACIAVCLKTEGCVALVCLLACCFTHVSHMQWYVDESSLILLIVFHVLCLAVCVSSILSIQWRVPSVLILCASSHDPPPAVSHPLGMCVCTC